MLWSRNEVKKKTKDIKVDFHLNTIKLIHILWLIKYTIFNSAIGPVIIAKGCKD